MHKIQQVMIKAMIPEFFPWVHYLIPKYFMRKLTHEDQFIELSDKLKEFFKVSKICSFYKLACFF